MKRGIALAALKLSNPQSAVESGQPAAQIPSQRRFVETMCRQYRHQLCHPRHLWPLVVDRACENPTGPLVHAVCGAAGIDADDAS
jgi:hypothetical protein